MIIQQEYKNKRNSASMVMKSFEKHYILNIPYPCHPMSNKICIEMNIPHLSSIFKLS